MENIYKKNKTKILKILDTDETVLNNLEVEFNSKKENPIKFNLQLYPLIILGLVLISNVLKYLFNINTKFNSNKNMDFILFSCTDKIFRTRNLNMLAGDLNYSIYYIPNFHVRSLIKYNKYFKDKNKNDVCYGIFSFKDYLQFLIRYLKNYSFFKNLMRKKLNENGKFIQKQFINYLLYDTFIKNHFKNFNNNSIKLLFEHQKFYFLPVVNYFKIRNFRTIHFQHGAMFHISSDYIPLFADETTCCSKREQNLYLKSGVLKHNIHILGAPLQTINKNQTFFSNRNKSSQFEVIILLSMITKSNIFHYIQMLKALNKSYSNTKILLRFRPRSKEKDVSQLKSYLKNFKISFGKTLAEDLSRSNKVITFSEDTIFEILKSGNQFIFINSSNTLDPAVAYKAVSINNNFTEVLNSFINNDLLVEKYIFSKKEQTDLIGEIDNSILKSYFKRIISKHKKLT